MLHFQTSIDSLTLTAIEPSCSTDKEAISGYCDAIVDDAESCNGYYLTRSNNDTYHAHNETFTSYAVTLEDMFTKATTFDSCCQLTLVRTLQQTLCQHKNEDYFAEAFMKRYDATLQEILTQLLETRNAPLESSKHMKRAAFELLTVILGVCRPFESLSWVTERLYNLDWSESLNEQARINSTMIFVSTIESYGQSVLERLDPTLTSEYTASLVTPCVQAASYVDNIVKKISPEEDHGDFSQTILTVLAIINTILDLVSFCYDVPSKSSGDTATARSTAEDLLTLVFDKFVLNTDLGLSHAYYERFHSTYTINNPDRAKVGSSTVTAPSEIMDCIYRCLALAKQNGLAFDTLLALKQRQHDLRNVQRSLDNLPRSLMISNDGIMSILALSIYERYLDDSSANGHFLLSLSIEPAWIGRHCLGMIMDMAKNPQEIPKIDKAILILLYLADNVDDTHFKVTLDMLDQEFEGLKDGGDQKMTLAKAFQILTSITSMVDDPKLRFLGHQLIARFIQLGNDDTRLFILTELLGNCPFPTMHTAAIGLLKNQVDHSFRLLPRTSPSDRSVFCTRILLDSFFPMIFKNQVDKTSTDDEHTSFWDKYSYHMQALNFYYYLMMRDKSENNTGVWDEDQVKWMRDTYLVPLKELSTALYGTYQQKQVHHGSIIGSTPENEEQYSKMMQLDLLNDVIERVTSMNRHG